jgi:SAM-dependent methyltransferase
VLDVGCGAGAWSEHLRASGGRYLVGIDASAAACAAARARYDLVVHSRVEDATLAELGGEPFDVVIAADVLEHLVDPWSVLARLRSWARDGARLGVSVPNARSVKIIGPLLAGRFEYDPAGGLRDRGHLRWFTRRSLSSALAGAGWLPLRCAGNLGPRRRFLSALTFGAATEFLWDQLFVVSRAAPAGAA